jgi:hypothetical protein
MLVVEVRRSHRPYLNDQLVVTHTRTPRSRVDFGSFANALSLITVFFSL